MTWFWQRRWVVICPECGWMSTPRWSKVLADEQAQWHADQHRLAEAGMLE